MTRRSERRRAADDAWRAYVHDGSDPGIGVGEEIGRSWRRCHETHRIDPALTRPGRLLSADDLALRREHDHAFRLATPILGELASRLGLHEAVLAYLDADGWMLSIAGDDAVIEEAREIDFRPGARWSEDVAGTNGPGTALAEGKAVEVFASEHFVAAWHGWSCAAAPVLASGDGTPVAVVDITAPWEVQRRHALLIAKAISRAIEERLRAAASVRDEVVRYALRAAHETGDALVAVDARGRFVGANDAAVRRRIVERAALAPALKDAIAAALHAQPAGFDDVRLDAPDGGAMLASPVQHEGAIVGAILRVPARSASPRPARRASRHGFHRVLGTSPPLRRALELAQAAGRTDLPVLLSGEPGTGKELLARAIHSAGTRAGGPFVAVSCGAVERRDVEGVLFGQERGAFPGTRRDASPGRFEDADGGTLFLDDVGELPASVQAALVRVLQEREVVRLGGTKAQPLDVRVIAASDGPLDEKLRARRVRRDLYYRLSVISIAVPALRDRGDDVALLARAFLAGAEADVERPLELTADALDALRAHPWPENVRELKHVILRAAAMTRGAEIAAADLLLEARAHDPAPAAGQAPRTLRSAMLDTEREALLTALDASEWNLVRAAERLGVSRMTIYRRLRRHGISRAPSTP